MPTYLRPLVVALLLVATAATAGAQGLAKKKPLGPTINTTTHRELIPVISPDGQTLWFIREGQDAELGTKVNARLEADLKVLEAQLDKLPPEQRKMLEDTIKQSRAAAPKIAASGPVKQTIFMSRRQPDGDGKYQIALPTGEDYGFRASASGYIAISDRIDLTGARDRQVFERNLVLVPIATGVPIRLNNIFFDTAKTELLPKSQAELNRLAALLRDTPTMRIEIRGHTDTVDDDAFNQKLSDGRAAAVVAYLAKAGIAANRLQSKGFGESQPVAPNTDDKGRLQNRRVEFVILAR